MATPVGVDHGRLAGRERRRGPGAHRPRDRPAAETVDRRAEVAPLAGRQPELGDAGHPQLVGAPGAEQVRPVRQQRQVGGRGRRLAAVAAPGPAPAPPAGPQALLAHQAEDHLLRDARAAPPELGPHRAVPPAAAHPGE